MTTFNPGWYLLYTKPRHEKKVNCQLTQLDINSFLPTKKVIRNWHDRKKLIDEPLFPSYIFIFLNDIKHYYASMETDGSLYYVRSGKNISRISEKEINNIKLATSCGQNVDVSEKPFKIGESVVISKGALTGLSCEIIQFNGDQKLLVRVDLLQRSLLLTMAEECLAAV